MERVAMHTGIRRTLVHAAVAGALLLCPQTAGADVVTWVVDDDKREAIVFAPSTPQGGRKVPLVFSFHGRGDNMQNFQHTNLHRAWPDAIVVYCQGLPTRAGGGLSGWQVERGQDHDRDLKFVDRALASLRRQYPIDDDRIYATGFSNGGMFTYLLWAERPSVFAAYAPNAARLRPSVQLKEPRPLFHIAGERDQQVAFGDQQAAIAMAVGVNRVSEEPTSCGDGCRLYGSHTAAPVMTWIHRGGHDYPTGTAQRIAAFFRDHPRKH